MIKINLLPFKRKRSSTVSKDVRDLIIMIIVVCIGFGLYYYRLISSIDDQKAEILTIKREIQSLQPIAQEYHAIQEAKKEIQKRIQTVDQLKSGRALAARSLYDVSSIIKEGVWIKTFRKTDNKFEDRSRSFVNEKFSDFIESLSKMHTFQC
jgi:Tfp pilus assembly protein PilN